MLFASSLGKTLIKNGYFIVLKYSRLPYVSYKSECLHRGQHCLIHFLTDFKIRNRAHSIPEVSYFLHCEQCSNSVSYTHLDVYKRQVQACFRHVRYCQFLAKRRFNINHFLVHFRDDVNILVE